MNKLSTLSKKDKIIYIIVFSFYSIINFFLLLKHEPWRDEIHAWLMSKVYSIPELFIASNFDGHPILWHLLLMPFAKLNFPIITLNIINYIIILISAFIFLFRSKLSTLFKIIVLFTIPFTYTYSVIARNYSLIVLFFVILSLLYPKRYENPLLYSIIICLLIHTHSLVWGVVAGLTITFHFIEVYKYIRYKNVKNIKSIVLGLTLIVINTLIVIFELYGTNNTDYLHGINSYVIYIVSIIIFILITFFACSIWIKSYWKEYIIIACGFTFQILVYTCFYSSILYQRLILIFVLMLFYISILASSNLDKKKLDVICILYLIFMCIFALQPFTEHFVNDYKYNYSSATELADYINEYLPTIDTVLIDNSTMGQSIIPYLNNCRLYDIDYNCYVDCSNVSHNLNRLNSLLSDVSKYSGNYLIICNNFVQFDSNIADCLFQTNNSMTNEQFTLYYIH